VKKEGFLRAVRREREKFRVDQIRIDPPGEAVTGKGTLCAEKGHFTLEVTLDDPERVPQTPKGFSRASSFCPDTEPLQDPVLTQVQRLPSADTRVRRSMVAVECSC